MLEGASKKVLEADAVKNDGTSVLKIYDSSLEMRQNFNPSSHSEDVVVEMMAHIGEKMPADINQAHRMLKSWLLCPTTERHSCFKSVNNLKHFAKDRRLTPPTRLSKPEL